MRTLVVVMTPKISNDPSGIFQRQRRLRKISAFCSAENFLRFVFMAIAFRKSQRLTKFQEMSNSV